MFKISGTRNRVGKKVSSTRIRQYVDFERKENFMSRCIVAGFERWYKYYYVFKLVWNANTLQGPRCGGLHWFGGISSFLLHCVRFNWFHGDPCRCHRRWTRVGWRRIGCPYWFSIKLIGMFLVCSTVLLASFSPDTAKSEQTRNNGSLITL